MRDETRSLLVGNQWQLQGRGMCARCEQNMAESWVFRWCGHVFCAICAAAVVKACPLCSAQAPVLDEDIDVGEMIEEDTPSCSWRSVNLVMLVILYLGCVAWLSR